MASLVPSFVSNPQEQKWVTEIDLILNHQLQITAETPSVSLYHVPQTITTKKPEAYEPQQLGLGPIHHFQPQPYKKMQQKKLNVVRKVLQDNEIKDYDLMVLDKVVKLLPIIRSCYDMFLQGSDDTLARVFAIDGLFLLNLLHTCNSQILENNIEEDRDAIGLRSLNLLPHPKPPKVSPKRRLLAQDILMVENQIPFMVLKEIQEALHPSLGNSSDSANNFSPSVFRTFCEVHSPLELCSMTQSPPSVEHLLHYMYYSIVNNISEQKPYVLTPTLESSSCLPHFGRMHDCPTPMDLLGSACSFTTKIPQKEIVQAYEQTILILETFSQSEILIPSASKLHGKAGYNFYVLKKYEGIQNIWIQINDIYLPCITLNTDSDVILRNLVAFETLNAKSDDFPLTEYVTLMCALITNVEDVKLLKSQNVIRGDLGDAEVAKLFIGLSSSMPTMRAKGKNNFHYVLINEINNVYERGLRVKTYLHLKKVASWLLIVLKAIGGFVGASWKIVAFMISIVTVFCLIWQAYCDSFGCDKTSLTSLPYSSG